MIRMPGNMRCIGCVVCIVIQFTQSALGENGHVLSESATPGPSLAPRTTAIPDWLEMDILGFRLWMIVGFVIVGISFVVIVLCCLFDCRLPRTKQEIEASHERRRKARGHATIQQAVVGKYAKNTRTPAGGRHIGPRYDTETNTSSAASHRPARHPQGIEIDMSSIHTTPRESHGSHVNGDFQLYQKPYGRRLQYIPGQSLNLGNTNGLGHFRSDAGSIAHSLSSLPRQANSKV